MKKIMILGGGETQIPLLLASKNENYCIVLCDGKDDVPGKNIADIFYCISTVDKEAVLTVARNEQIDGVISNSEYAMMTVAYVAETLGLPGSSCNSIDILSSKDKFRTFQNTIGIYAPEHFASDSFDEINEYAKKMRYPIVIKPVKSSGSRGTTILDDYQEERLRELFEANRMYSRNGQCTIEEYVNMGEPQIIDGDVFVLNDKIIWDGLFSSIRSDIAPLIPMTQVYPVWLSDWQLAEVKDTLQLIFKEAHINHGEYNVELFFDNAGRLFVIEINVRQGGNGIPDAIRKYCGIDMNKLLITTTVGDNSYFEELYGARRHSEFLSRHPVFSDNDGILDAIEVDPKLNENFDSIFVFIKKGEIVEKRKNAESVIGLLDFVFRTREEQIMYSTNLEKYITVKLYERE